ncbi:VOC family protein [Streptococcus pneumoniae]
MIDHFSIRVKDLQASKIFYTKTLAPLGYEIRFDNAHAVSFGEAENTDPGGDFWLEKGQQVPMHFAFHAKTHREVDLFYQAGLAAGARDNGMPGLRPHYHSNYYAVFLIDPDGNNIEAVCHSQNK